MSRQESLVLVAGELAATIRMQYQWQSILALPERHEHRLKDQLAIMDSTRKPAGDERLKASW